MLSRVVMRRVAMRKVGTAKSLKQVRCFTENKQSSGLSSILQADNGKMSIKLQHMANLSLLGLFPTALLLSPSKFNVPVDIAMGLYIPMHSHISLNNVISDYVPKSYRMLARVGCLGLSSVLLLGLLRLNISGVGITESIKSFWRPVQEK